jgi:hypothetical protein
MAITPLSLQPFQIARVPDPKGFEFDPVDRLYGPSFEFDLNVVSSPLTNFLDRMRDVLGIAHGSNTRTDTGTHTNGPEVPPLTVERYLSSFETVRTQLGCIEASVLNSPDPMRGITLIENPLAFEIIESNCPARIPARTFFTSKRQHARDIRVSKARWGTRKRTRPTMYLLADPGLWRERTLVVHPNLKKYVLEILDRDF